MFIREQDLRDLIRAYAEMWAEEWGNGENDWSNMLTKKNRLANHPEVQKALEALGETWEEFVTSSQKKHSA